MDTSTPATKFLEGVCVAIFIYILYEICMWYFRMQTSTSTSGSSCGCGKKKFDGKESKTFTSANHTVASLNPSQKACIAVGLCQNPDKTMSEIHTWKVAIIKGAEKIFVRDKAQAKKPASKSKRRR